MRTTMVALVVLTVTSVAAAQEKAAEEAKAAPAAQSQATEETRETPRPAIRVLRNPYDLSSFYRSGESPLGPWAGLPNDPAYGIAGFYRAPRPTPFRPYRRTIGENGDLFLVVPFLAPVGPISGAFSGN